MTLPAFSDPERSQILDDHHWRLDQLLLTGQIGEPTYLRSLFIGGMLPDEARTRLSLLKARET